MYMVDPSQIFIVAAITIMTVILSILGVQLIFVLRDLRVLMSRVNNIVGELEKIGLNIGHGYTEAMGFVSGVKNLFMLTDYIAEKKKKKHDKK